MKTKSNEGTDMDFSIPKNLTDDIDRFQTFLDTYLGFPEKVSR